MYSVIVLCLLLVVLYVQYKYFNIRRSFFRDTACIMLNPSANDTSTWRIPRIIYRSHKNKESAARFQGAWTETQRHNPTFRQILLTDEDMDRFVEKEFPGRIYSAYKSINPAYGAARCDFWRYLQIFSTGGIYLDVKSWAGDLRTIIHPSDGMLLGTEYDKKVLEWVTLPLWADGDRNYREFQQFYIAAAPKHPLLKAVIEEVVHGIENYDDTKYGNKGFLSGVFRFRNPAFLKVLDVTGPFAYTRAIKRAISEENVRDYRVLCPHLNDVIHYARGNVKIHGKSHYSQQKGPLVIKSSSNRKMN